MPELPEVHTTASILNTLIISKTIEDVWTDYESPHFHGKENIKDKSYFLKFKKYILNKKITKVWRRAKYILIELDDNSTIVIHMKMTGHLLYGTYFFDSKTKEWRTKTPGPLQDPFNRFIHFVLTFTDGTHLAFSDMRKFASVYFVQDKKTLQSKFEDIGPEPLEKNLTVSILEKQLLKRKNKKIKTALMDQTLISGIGNIYSDEILWSSQINPERTVFSLTKVDFKNIHTYTKKILSKGINFGGDSMSDYRNPYGLPGKFQLEHNAYRRTNKECKRTNCDGKILRKVINGRSAHFCSMCQK
jgi:formamidopyrimidine-DNA glycosylase